MRLLKKGFQYFILFLLAMAFGNQPAHADINIGQLQGVLNGLVAPQMMNETNKSQYTDRSGSEEIVDPQSGSLTFKQLDLALPGRDGLDLNIGRIYKSSEGEVGDKKVTVTSSSSTSTYTSSKYVVTVIGFAG